MPTLQAVKAENAKYNPSFRPVAIFVGGTSGIGQASAECFARYTNGNAHIIICGRNQQAAERIIATFPQHAASKYEFVHCDALLMSSIAKVSADLRQRLPKLNYLFLSQGMLTFQGRTETSEGIDQKMALHLYGRWKFVLELLPLLEKAKQLGEDARVMNVLRAGFNTEMNWDDIDLKQNYSFPASRAHTSTGNDIMEMARRHPNISFTHMYPGFVRTPLVTGSLLGKLLLPLTYFISVSQETAAQWLVYPLLSPNFAQGAFWLNGRADDVGPNKWSTDETRKKLYNHIVALTKTA